MLDLFSVRWLNLESSILHDCSIYEKCVYYSECVALQCCPWCWTLFTYSRRHVFLLLVVCEHFNNYCKQLKPSWNVREHQMSSLCVSVSLLSVSLCLAKAWTEERLFRWISIVIYLQKKNTKYTLPLSLSHNLNKWTKKQMYRACIWWVWRMMWFICFDLPSPHLNPTEHLCYTPSSNQ